MARGLGSCSLQGSLSLRHLLGTGLGGDIPSAVVVVLVIMKVRYDHHASIKMVIRPTGDSSRPGGSKRAGSRQCKEGSGRAKRKPKKGKREKGKERQHKGQYRQFKAKDN